MTVIATQSTDSINIAGIPAGEKTKEDKRESSPKVVPSPVISSSDCVATVPSNSDSESKERCRSVSSGDSAVVCRICQDPENPKELTTLCNCTGSIAKYHVKCLEQWLSVSNSDVCELCHGHFQTKRIPRPFTEWLRGLRSSQQSRYMYGDIVCLLVLTPLAMTSAALCGEGSWYYVSIGQVFIAIGLVALCTFLILLYIVWLVLSMRYHLSMWHKWRTENQVVKLIIPPHTRNPHNDTALKGTVV